MKNHFEFFDLPISFQLDEADLKRRFLVNSRKFHPDHYTLADEQKKEEMLELSAQNNLAYKVLRDFDSRMSYILEIMGLMKKGVKNELPPEFLFEMMEINEAIMELEMEPNSSASSNILSTVEEVEKKLMAEIQPILDSGKVMLQSTLELEKVKEVYLKKRYLWRIRENLNRFAPASKEAG